MDLSYGEEHEAFRAEVARFLRENWPPRGDEAGLPPEQQRARFRDRAIAAGYLYRYIPVRYGGSEREVDVLRDSIIQDEFAAARVPSAGGVGPGMLVPTLLEHGSEEQRCEFIPPTLRGEIHWCQGYSEPGSGSDLASLQSRAALDGDEWVIHGHKIWTSSAHEADFMFGLFRTEPDAPKHAGITYLLLDMKSPGIEVRPLKQMTGAVDFNEVFFSDVRTPVRYTVGRRGEGWKVGRSTLKHERNLIGNPRRLRENWEDLVALARGARVAGRPALEDPGIRRRLIELEGYVASQEYSSYRQLSAAARGEDAKVLAPQLMNKLVSSELIKKLTALAYDLLGGDGLIAPGVEQQHPGRMSKSAGGWTAYYMYAIGNAIGGGTSNIQRNIVGERVLGLPRDLRRGKEAERPTRRPGAGSP